jgi:hypothetical protein
MSTNSYHENSELYSLFGWLVADGWCWFVLREEYCWLVAGGWFDVREKYYWLVADKPSEQGVNQESDKGTAECVECCHACDLGPLNHM